MKNKISSLTLECNFKYFMATCDRKKGLVNKFKGSLNDIKMILSLEQWLL